GMGRGRKRAIALFDQRQLSIHLETSDGQDGRALGAQFRHEGERTGRLNHTANGRDTAQFHHNVDGHTCAPQGGIDQVTNGRTCFEAHYVLPFKVGGGYLLTFYEWMKTSGNKNNSIGKERLDR